MTTENKHCGKHDKIYTDDRPCPGCEAEKAAGGTVQNPEHGEEGHEHEEGDEKEEEPAHTRTVKNKHGTKKRR